MSSRSLRTMFHAHQECGLIHQRSISNSNTQQVWPSFQPHFSVNSAVVSVSSRSCRFRHLPCHVLPQRRLLVAPAASSALVVPKRRGGRDGRRVVFSKLLAEREGWVRFRLQSASRAFAPKHGCLIGLR
ncbi:hypothetical protein E2C01_007554 [Portunus trituberculatus]|uniref:Uncharacterized protein n=1 Tax=Portunus trituberculatus TaxID=210409 RepID=A0A5B7CZJ2_PORTR|nr:hypothetical protein [Portunus trituberculatus]